MARQHVFPFIEPGLKVIDNDVVNSLGDEQDISLGEYNANEDKNIEWFINSASNLGVGILYLGKEDHEALIDFNEAPNDVYSQVSGPAGGSTIFQLFFGPSRNAGSSGEIDVELNFVPGSVFCVGLKNKASVLSVKTFLFYSTLSDYSDAQFVFNSLYDGFSFVNIGVGKWNTFMFDGKRFVHMGSNNWY